MCCCWSQQRILLKNKDILSTFTFVNTKINGSTWENLLQDKIYESNLIHSNIHMVNDEMVYQVIFNELEPVKNVL